MKQDSITDPHFITITVHPHLSTYLSVLVSMLLLLKQYVCIYLKGGTTDTEGRDRVREKLRLSILYWQFTIQTAETGFVQDEGKQGPETVSWSPIWVVSAHIPRPLSGDFPGA